MRKKILTLLLCCALVSGLVPTVNISAYALEPEQEQTLLVCQNGEAVTEAELPISQKITLQADVYPEDFAAQGYQWQIQVPGGIWVDIAGEAQKSINLTYGMVASLLDSSNAVQIRCKLTDDRVGAMLSNEVRVTVDDSRPIPELPLENGTVLREAEAVETPAQAAPTQEEVSTPTQDETPADTNTEAPAQDPAEPTETSNADSEPAAPDAETQTPAAADPADNAADADAASPAPADAADVPASDLNTAGTPADDLNSTGAGLDNSPADVIGNLPAPIPALEQVKNTLQENAAALADENSEPTGETGENEKDTYSIIINYVFVNGTQAANPWTATVAKGSDYTQTVNSPIVVGYKPDQTSVEVNVANIQADQNYTVTYSPAVVKFTVKHYQQNVDNDNYTLVDTEEKEGYTESLVSDKLAKTYEGFYALLYDVTTTVAADGSTVVEIYYDRNYYLMNFDLDGGYGVEPIYARYGSAIEVGPPTKAGYEFNGWSAVIPETMPAMNRSYKALWKESTAKVTIVFWGENADDKNYSYMDSFEIQSKPGTELKYDPNAVICGLEEHTHTAACGYNCGLEEHAHTYLCYEGASADKINFRRPPNNPKQGQIYVSPGGINGTGIYIGNEWYEYSGSASGGDVISPKCGKTAHAHASTCGYSCGKAAHTHDASCKMNKVQVDSALWKLVRSDTVTVNGDGSTILNVYYDRTTFTLTFKDGNKTVKTIEDKWGAKIFDEFNNASFTTTYEGCAWKCTESDKYNYALQTLDRMPKFDATFELYNKSSDNKKTIYYYVQKVGTTVNSNQWPNNNTNFELLKQVDTYFNYATYNEEYHEIQGFTRYSASVAGFDGGNSKDFSNAKLNLYYLRDEYTLIFHNYNSDVAGKGGSVQYEAPLSSYNFTPDYPADLETNAYEFAGWYTSPGCFDGSEVNWNTMKMPANDVTLYAKWVPKTHTVRTFLTADALDTAPAEPMGTQTVTHGKTAIKPEKPENGEYEFIGWFYRDGNGAEKAFDFSMPVNRDLDLYAKWSSNKLVEYTIKYTLEDGTIIAAATKGSALAGTTKTFEAKTGTALNESYQTGYFPKTNSHSLTMDIEGGNEFTFIYVPKAEVSYIVRYLEKGTNKVLHTEKKAKTRDAVITEKFEQVTGYAPDAYQKRLVLSADEEANVITFWYVKDDEHAPVQIIHWTQNIAGEDYTEYQSSTNLNGEIGKEYTESALNIPGFTYNATNSNAGGTLTAEGLVLNLYYDRIEYPYAFRFVEGDTNKILADAVTGAARYQAQVTQSALNIPGYTLVSAENQAIHIAIEDPADTAKNNVRIFYYTEKTVDIKYQVVGSNGCGTLSSYQDNSVKVKTGTVQGSVPTAAKGFRFVGWYKDEACTVAVDSSWIDQDKKLMPQKENGMYQAAVYYAKFERALADLTITKSGWNEIDENQSFIFHIKGTDANTSSIDLKVVVHGNGSVTIKDLPVGTYEVTEENVWSWRYVPNKTSQEIDLQSNGTLPFSNSRTNENWLNGNAFCDNRWMNSTKQESN